jgi:hypothetical protein
MRPIYESSHVRLRDIDIRIDTYRDLVTRTIDDLGSIRKDDTLIEEWQAEIDAGDPNLYQGR